eukprot:15466378-Alexandrium_andersonii.AAC.1
MPRVPSLQGTEPGGPVPGGATEECPRTWAPPLERCPGKTLAALYSPASTVAAGGSSEKQ